jgi:hypothetical protein
VLAWNEPPFDSDQTRTAVECPLSAISGHGWSGRGVRLTPLTDIRRAGSLLVQAGFEGSEFVGRGTVKRGHARRDCDNECGGNPKEKQQRVRRLVGSGALGHPGRLAGLREG